MVIRFRSLRLSDCLAVLLGIFFGSRGDPYGCSKTDELQDRDEMKRSPPGFTSFGGRTFRLMKGVLFASLQISTL